MPAGRIELDGIHEVHKLLVIQERLEALRIPAVIGNVHIRHHLLVELGEEVHGVQNRRLLAFSLLKGMRCNDAGPVVIAIGAGKLLTLVTVHMMLNIRIVLGGHGDAAGQSRGMKVCHHGVLACLDGPALREGGGDAVDRNYIACHTGSLRGDDLEAVQHRAELAVVEIVVNVGVILRIECLKADLHAKPLAHQSLTVIHDDIHSGRI